MVAAPPGEMTIVDYSAWPVVVAAGTAGVVAGVVVLELQVKMDLGRTAISTVRPWQAPHQNPQSHDYWQQQQQNAGVLSGVCYWAWRQRDLPLPRHRHLPEKHFQSRQRQSL
jgi:hypothetical protein